MYLTDSVLYKHTVFDLIIEHTLISGHPPFCAGEDLPEHVEIYVYWLYYCVASCNRYLMLINHPTGGDTRGLTLRVRLLGSNLKKDNIIFLFFFMPRNSFSGLFAN